MCEVMENYMRESVERSREEGRINSLKELIMVGIDKKQLLKVYTEAEYQKALN